MYIRKSVGPRMDPWGTPALTGYFCAVVAKDSLQPYIKSTRNTESLILNNECHPKPNPKNEKYSSVFRTNYFVLHKYKQ